MCTTSTLHLRRTDRLLGRDRAFTLARKSGWRHHPTVRAFPDVDEIIEATDNGIFLPRTLVFNELAGCDAPGDTKDHADQR